MIPSRFLTASRILIVFFCLFLVILSSAPTPKVHAEEMATVVEIIDGDTLLIEWNGKREAINLLGIDAPESVMNRKAEMDSRQTGESLLDIASKGIDAKRFVERIVRKGDLVALAFNGQMRDQEGTLQGYVYLPDGRMLNEEIVRAGYAKPVTAPPPVKFHERFRKAYKEARAYRRGLLKSP